ncbi:MAG: polyphosphate kinase 2 family protein [Planctomycetota bacterium]
MDYIKKHRVKPGQPVDLSKVSSTERGGFESKTEARERLAEINEVTASLQYRLFVERKQSLLVVLQAPDAAGKDGTIRKVFGPLNPQGCRTFPFKVPSDEEAAHDFLWRIHKATPADGMISVFNRSHYEDVLVVRVEDLVPKAVWKQRYEIINDFERALAAAGTRILKFYLHISESEQLERFGKRLQNPEKHWKLNPGDYAARDKWHDYQKAYEDAIERCSHPQAPWFIIPSDHKWYRDVAVAGILLETLQDMQPELPPVDVDLKEIEALYQAELDKQAKEKGIT